MEITFLSKSKNVNTTCPETNRLFINIQILANNQYPNDNDFEVNFVKFIDDNKLTIKTSIKFHSGNLDDIIENIVGIIGKENLIEIY